MKKKYKYLDGDEIGHYYLPNITDEWLLYLAKRIINSPKKKIVLRKSN